MKKLHKTSSITTQSKELKMKTYHRKITSSFITLLLILGSFSSDLNAQNRRPQAMGEDGLTGTWVMDFRSAKRSMTSEMKAVYQKADNKTRSLIGTFHKDQKFTFSLAGSFKVTQKDGKSEMGKWKISGNDSVLELVFDSGARRKFRIKQRSKTRLILKAIVSNKQAKPLLSEWHLIKK